MTFEEQRQEALKKSKYDGDLKIRKICEAFGWDDFIPELHRMYNKEQMSCNEIAELIATKVDPLYAITPRSLQRKAKDEGYIRSTGDAFRMAAAKGRVKWAFKDEKYKRKTISAAKRYKILLRDGFTCTLCGATKETHVIQLDHIIPVCKGGSDDESNLRALCHECNIGKRIVDKER